MRSLAKIFVSCIGIVLLCSNLTLGAATEVNAVMSGELKQWHKVTLTVDGPTSSEDAKVNPFLDYRMQVTFQHSDSGLTYVVPGYFAADGDSANSASTSGNKWRAHVSPDHVGPWTYSVSFRSGSNVSISDDQNAGSAIPNVDGLKGSFEIAKTDKTGRDFRAKGRLQYVGKHHLQFAGSKEYFLKAGADAPENFLSYDEFDGDFKTDGHKDGLVKNWAPHVQDWNPGDPTWQGGKGKGMIGAVNYLASQGLNVFSFLTLNIGGDDRNVFPYLTYDERSRIDCSRMDQWETVFEHGTQQGMYLHFKTLECENVNLLDNGKLGPQRKLYYRELIARFGHHLALNWNLGEEVGYVNPVSTENKVAWASYFATHDPYHHHMVIHNGNKHYDMLGDNSALTGFSLQTNRADFGNVHGATLDYIRRSVKAGKPWVVACDEPGDASHSLVTDAENPDHNNARTNALWGNLMAGGAGIEWYFGYKHPHSDLSCQDYRVRQNMWVQSHHALKFFQDNKIPFWNMSNADGLLNHKNAYCLQEPGQVYLVFLKTVTETTIDLSGSDGVFEIMWFHPKTGGALQTGTIQAVKAGAKVQLGAPPRNLDEDWLAVLRPGNPKADYPPGVRAGSATKTMLPRNGDPVSVDLTGAVNSIGQGSKVTAKWTKVSGPGAIEFADSNAAKTNVTFKVAGDYVLNLRANDGKQTSNAQVTISVKPFQSQIVRSIQPSAAVYLEGANFRNDRFLKVEGKRRISFIKFDIQNLPPKVLDVQLRLTVDGDSGSGKLRIFNGTNSDWDGQTMTTDSKPQVGKEVAAKDVSLSDGDVVMLPVRSLINQDGTYTLVLKLNDTGNDIWFAGLSSKHPPALVVTFDDTDGQHSSFGKRASRPPATKTPSLEMMLEATKHFSTVNRPSFVPSYADHARKALAINAANHQNKFAASEAKFDGKTGTYNFTLTTLTETDGESSYRVSVAGTLLAEVQNPESQRDYQPILHSFKNVKLKRGDAIQVEFNTHSNGKIPEGNAFAFSRGRWQSLSISNQRTSKVSAATTSLKAATPKVFKYTYDVTKAKEVHKQSQGIVVVEAEDFDAVDRQDHRKWHLTTADQTAAVQPDPDPNHSAGASAGAYLEILPDTRVTHNDPLVNGVSFCNTPGQCSVLYYPVEFQKAGRYYVWVRMCCTGSEDNGLHVGIDGQWPNSGARLQFTGKHGQWQWDSRQRTDKVHTGVLGKIWLDVDEPGLHTIMFSMREDGFEFDKFLLTQNPKPMQSKSGQMGPDTSK
ncbi:MAG: DUF5060 domain-containing protein [Fuerstiella sp.]